MEDHGHAICVSTEHRENLNDPPVSGSSGGKIRYQGDQTRKNLSDPPVSNLGGERRIPGNQTNANQLE